MKISIRLVVVQLITAMLIFLFAYAAISKFFNFNIFRYNLSQAPFIGRYGNFASVAIPAVNLSAVLLLLIPRTRRVGLLFSLLLLLCYSGYIGYVLIKGRQLPCSCNGVFPWLSWTDHLWFNLIITALIITGLLLSKRFIAINQSALASAGDRESRKPV